MISNIRENDINNAAMDVMQHNFDFQDDPQIGSFWWDKDKKELFGVSSVPGSSQAYYHSSLFNCNVRTGPKLHQTVWKKEVFRKKDSRFFGDYTMVPRGRVFQFEDIGYIVFTGNWIKDFPEAKREIIIEFDLPEEITEFRIDEHWDLGHGWSNDFV